MESLKVRCIGKPNCVVGCLRVACRSSVDLCRIYLLCCSPQLLDMNGRYVFRLWYLHHKYLFFKTESVVF